MPAFRRLLLPVIVMFALPLGEVPAFARPTTQTAAFTYQGVLKQSGSPMNASVDLQFRLFDAAIAGNQIGSTLVSAPVTVADGLFNVSLDFGALAFNGDERWVEIGVCSPPNNGSGPFTPLTPRQKLASAPYATHALGVNGATVTGINAANIATGTIDNARTTATNANTANRIVLRDASGNFSANVITGAAFVGSGASLSLLNAGAVSSGTLSDARLSSNVMLLNSAQSISGAKTFATAPSFTAAAAPFSVSSSNLVANLNADTVDGLHASAFLQSVPSPLLLTGSNPGLPLIEGVNTSATVDATGVHGLASGLGFLTHGVHGEVASTIGRGVFGEATAATGVNYGVYGLSASTAGRGVFGQASAATGTTMGGRFENLSTSGIGVMGAVFATSGTVNGGFFQTESTSGRGLIAFADVTTGTAYGVRAESGSTGGRGLFAWSYADTGATYGVLAQADSTAGTAVRGNSTAITGTTYGGYFDADSPDSRAVYGEASSTTGFNYGGRFLTNSPDGRGASGRNTASTGNGYGVQGQSDSTSGTGVFGLATATTGVTFGVYGQSDSTSGKGVYGRSVDNIGVHGEAVATTGINYGVVGESDSSSGRGVYGRANSAVGTVYGVYGENDNGAGGYGVFADGDMGCNAFKTFRIDHPQDPANKYLIHYSAESDEVINFYSGKATLNGAGEAVIDLPAYFALVNKDPRYTLTAIGAAMPSLHVAMEIDETALALGVAAEPGQPAPPCWFKIAGGAPGMKVSWRVDAVRNDRYARSRQAVVELEKQGPERGTYQQPELFGQDESKSLANLPRATPRRTVRDADPEARSMEDEGAPTRAIRGG